MIAVRISRILQTFPASSRTALAFSSASVSLCLRYSAGSGRNVRSKHYFFTATAQLKTCELRNVERGSLQPWLFVSSVHGSWRSVKRTPGSCRARSRELGSQTSTENREGLMGFFGPSLLPGLLETAFMVAVGSVTGWLRWKGEPPLAFSDETGARFPTVCGFAVRASRPALRFPYPRRSQRR